MSDIIMEAEGLRKWFPLKGGLLHRTKGHVRAVDGINLKVPRGETFGLVGESGCGKTTVGRLLLHLIEPTAGDVLFDSNNIFKMYGEKKRQFRCKAQIVFQNPFSSLDPRMTVRHIVGDPMRLHKLVDSINIEEKVTELLEKVRLNRSYIDRYPHEFSGGERQRIAIARALALNPIFIVLDEPTSSLDVSVQAKILNDLQDLQKEAGLTYLFISHDLSVIKHMSSRIAVMYVGKIVEFAKSNSLFSSPQHPYSQAMLSAIPVPDPDIKTARIILPGDVASPVNPPSGCRFHPRCPIAIPKCSVEEPELVEVGKEHFAACYLAGQKITTI